MSKKNLVRKPQQFRATVAMLVVVIIAAAGAYLLTTSHAQSPYVASEAEGGTLSGTAAKVADASASGGNYVTLGTAPGGGTSGTPHIMVIVMENESIGDIVGNPSAPYETSLGNSYEVASNYYSVGHNSLDNYLALISGNFYQSSVNDCNPGGSCSFSDPTLAQQLDSAKIPWKAYMENMTQNCEGWDDGEYAVRHDPFVYFPAVVSSDCNKVVPASSMISNLNSTSPPDFVWLTPNLCDDMHDCSIATGDSYLSSKIPAIQATTWYKQGGTIALTFDEGDGNDNGGQNGDFGGQVFTVIISAATASKPDHTAYMDHYGLLRSIENAYSLSCLASACNASSGSLTL